MDSNLKTVGKVDLGAFPESEGWKEVLQLLREQSKKIEVLARALSVIQQGMLRNNPNHVKDSVNESTEVLSEMLNTHKCLLGNGVKIQKKLESHPASKKILKTGGDVSNFEKALDQPPGRRGEVKSLVSKRSLEVRDLDETVTREDVVAALCIALGKPDLGDQCRLQTAAVRLTEADARSLLGLGRPRVRWVNCRIREHVEVARCFRCQGYGHVSPGCMLPGRKDACWRCGTASHVVKECKAPPRCLTCADRGEKDVAYASGSDSCTIFRAELLRLRGGK